MKTAASLLIAVVGLLASPAVAQSKPIVVENAWVRTHDGVVTVYFHILNNGDQPDRLLAVSTPVADKATLTRTRIRSGKYSYQAIDSLEVGGFDDPRLRPGGIHVRLTGLKRNLAVGESVPLSLRFERAGTVDVAAKVSNQLLGNR
jgi:periplasmic copper chaperone A